MLKTRVITAVCLLAVFLPSLFWLPQHLWACLMAVFVGIGAWEWGALLRWSPCARRLLGGASALACLVLAVLFPDVTGASGTPSLFPPWVQGVYFVAALFWVLVVPLWMRRKWALKTAVVGLVTGGVLLLPTWLALVQLRTLGPEVLLAILAVVWVADIAAYFAGRRFGKHKLAPAISPGKTWEGAFGAVIGVVIYGSGMYAAFSLTQPPILVWVIGLLGVTAISIIGDLFESMLKRQAGIKDSSNILPGHGGVLDRIDSLTSTLPVVALLWLLMTGLS
jgi:phosphatidate cytidylyltransferase